MTKEQESKTTKQDEEKDSYGLFWISAIVIIILVCLYGCIIYKLFPDWTTRGTFGDAFGAINALFSGLAFAGVVFAIILQKKELKAQRNELELSRIAVQAQQEELQMTRSEFVKQNETMAIQRFETTFFNLFQDLKESDEKLKSFWPGSPTFSAQNSVFRNIYANIKNSSPTSIPLDYTELTEIERGALLELIQNVVEKLPFKTKFMAFEHATTSLLSYIKNTGLKENSKPFYIELLKGQLSSQNLCVIALSTLSQGTDSKLSKLVKEFMFIDRSVINEDLPDSVTWLFEFLFYKFD